MKTFNIPVEESNYYAAVLEVLNFNLRLNKSQKNLLLTSLNNNITIYNKHTRRALRDKLGIDQYTFNNYFGTLKSKGIITKLTNTSNYQVNPSLLTLIKEGSYSFNITIKENDTNNRKADLQSGASISNNSDNSHGSREQLRTPETKRKLTGEHAKMAS